ncbi:MAG: PorT family protein [Bacteroidales bacterium]|nr:PorT family protein [Bacteroidales bacterium]
MKKFIVIIASLLVAVSAHAQFGVVAGITSSRTTLEDATADISNISQYHAGITYKIGFGNFFAIQPALLYNVKGAKISALTDQPEMDFKTGYIELPVQLQLGLGVGDIFRVYGLAEPFLGYAITNQVREGSSTTFEQTWENVKNRTEYGFSLGAGVELIKNVQVSVKYFWNLGQVNNLDIDSASTKVTEGKCNGISASVAILF